MKLKNVKVKNFRLLNKVELSLEDTTTVIVGRNNSGKTSLTELFEHLLSSTKPKFSLEDFSLSVHENFWSAFVLHEEKSNDSTIREKLPSIETTLTFSYDKDVLELGPLSDLVIDLSPDSTTAIVKINYQLGNGKIEAFFEGVPDNSSESERKKAFFKLMKDRVPQFYTTTLAAIDPTDDQHTKDIDLGSLKAILMSGFIRAQRKLDDISDKDANVLGKVLESILNTAKSETATPEDKIITKKLEESVQDMQEQLDSGFNTELDKLLPALKLFGYPGLNDSDLHTETILDVDRLLVNNTKLQYRGENGIGLPESYNGLGSRNLIYILFQLYEYFKSFQTSSVYPSVHLIFIEEPEAHLHPQMQEVFIRKLDEIASAFSKIITGQIWPVQYIITTHSSHLANEAPFEGIRYFLAKKNPSLRTEIKDLRVGFQGDSLVDDKKFLHKYLTLTRCDLFFADKAILIEGATERLMLPRIIDALEKDPAFTKKLSTQYFSCVEVGGAHAHHFFGLLKFLELNTLIVTDIDFTKKQISKGKTTYNKCKFSESTHTSNTCLKKWFENNEIKPLDLTNKKDSEKIKERVRIAYQIPESSEGGPCGRSFEESFMLANTTLFDIQSGENDDMAEDAWDKAGKVKNKTDFALEYALLDEEWVVPRYLKEGLLWLSSTPADSKDKE